MAYRRPHGPTPKPIGDLLEATSRLYAAAFKPVLLAAGAGALMALALALLTEPGLEFFPFLRLMVLLAIAISAQAAVLPLALAARGDQPFPGGTPWGAVSRFGPRYFAGVVGIALMSGTLFYFFLPTPLALFLLVNSFLFGPALVVEDLGITGALQRSWSLVRGRWWHTFSLYLTATAIAALPLIATLIVGAIIGSKLVTYLLLAGAVSVSVPFFAIFALLVFEDYRGLVSLAKDDTVGPFPKDF